MLLTDAVAYLHDRVRQQRNTKTHYNRLRWTLADLAAVDALLAAHARNEAAAARNAATEQPAPATV